jgi:hypothetical protein
MPSYLMVDTILKDWQEFDTVEAAETYCNIKMIYVPALMLRLKTGVLVLVIATGLRPNILLTFSSFNVRLSLNLSSCE